MTKIVPQRTHLRIVGALRLQPMTQDELARCLCVSKASILNSANLLVQKGTVARERSSGHTYTYQLKGMQ